MSTNFLSDITNKMEQTKADFNLLTAKDQAIEKVMKLNPNEIGNWEFRDRQDFELGDIEALAESISHQGQAQPIIVVEANSIFKTSDTSKDTQYIVIAGYRRWLACKSKNINVDAIVRRLNFDQAIACLVSENEKEKVSDYSKGIFYHNLLIKDQVTKKNLYEKLRINRSVFDNYLSFAEVPKEVWDAVGDMSKVSARTSYTVKSICQKGEKEKRAILAIADKISLGIGEKKITALVNKILAGDKFKVRKNATRVAFKKNIYMDIEENSLILTAKKIQKEDVHELKEKISKLLKNYFENIIQTSI